MSYKILIINSSPFLPIKNGSNKAIYEYCNILKELGVELYFCCFTYSSIPQETINYFNNNVFNYQRSPKRKLFSKAVISKFRLKFCKDHRIDDYYPWGIEHLINSLDNTYHFDMCIINYITLSKIFNYIKIPRKVVFTHDVFSNKLKILGTNNFWFYLTPNEEAKGLERCTDIIAIQENEAIFFHYLAPQKNIYTVYSPFPIVSHPLTYNNNILFIAGNNMLNLNGIKNFLDKIFPKILREVPSVNLLIGGSICNALSEYTQYKEIKLLGKIEDINKFYDKGDIAINPVYQGTGLKIKTFEALSHGKVTIVHKHSADGIFNPNKAPLLIAEDHEQFVDLIISTLKDYKLRQTYSESSLKYISELNSYVKDQYTKIINK